MQLLYGQQYLIDSIESIQRRAARWNKCDYKMTSSVSKMLQELQWPILERRHLESKLIMFYKFFD